MVTSRGHDAIADPSVALDWAASCVAAGQVQSQRLERGEDLERRPRLALPLKTHHMATK
jgi:hypothetical protein